MRGNPHYDYWSNDVERSIPACAGEPTGKSAPQPGQSVYPRVCGGTAVRLIHQLPNHGLSPRVRGNLAISRAGFLKSRVYPRVCGGTRCAAIVNRSFAGLSPRVRGNQNRRTEQYKYYRSIPACAGEPCSHSVASVSTRVYPRVCGGTPRISPPPTCRSGLSPRVRGNPHQVSRVGSDLGSIPACAGEPSGPNGRTTKPRVYPRVCGGTRM